MPASRSFEVPSFSAFRARKSTSIAEFRRSPIDWEGYNDEAKDFKTRLTAVGNRLGRYGIEGQMLDADGQIAAFRRVKGSQRVAIVGQPVVGPIC